MNESDEVEFAQPKDDDERAAVAGACMLRLNFEMPMLLDDMSNQVDQAYRALPDRLYLVDAGGTIYWRSEQGPFGFDVETFARQVEALAGR